MTAFEPGSVVRLDGRKGNDFLLFRTEEGWVDAEGDFRPMLTDRGLANEVRTLVVIDPEDREQAGRLLDAYTNRVQQPYRGEDEPDDWRTDRMQAALREFASPTPQIEEPQGQGAVVEGVDGKRWLRRTVGGRNAWMHYDMEDRASRARDWSEIAAVRVLSEGVTP